MRFNSSYLKIKMNQDILSVIQSLEQGEEPFLLKLINGTASSEQIQEWATSNDISPENIDTLISQLTESFQAGEKMAEALESTLKTQTQDIAEIQDHVQHNGVWDKEKVLDQLEDIWQRLDTLQSEVSNLIDSLKFGE